MVEPNFYDDFFWDLIYFGMGSGPEWVKVPQAKCILGVQATKVICRKSRVYVWEMDIPKYEWDEMIFFVI